MELVEPGPRTGMRSALDAAPFSWSEHLASMRVRDILDVSDLRVMPAAGDLAGPLFSAPDVDRHMGAAIGRVFDLCDDEEAQMASRVDPYGTGRRLPLGVLPADEFMDLQRDRLFMSCDGSEPDAYIGYRYVLFDAWGQWGGYRTAEAALERYQESRVAVDGRYATHAAGWKKRLGLIDGRPRHRIRREGRTSRRGARAARDSCSAGRGAARTCAQLVAAVLRLWGKGVGG